MKSDLDPPESMSVFIARVEKENHLTVKTEIVVFLARATVIDAWKQDRKMALVTGLSLAMERVIFPTGDDDSSRERRFYGTSFGWLLSIPIWKLLWTAP